MAATLVLGTNVERRVGSSPTLGTNLCGFSLERIFALQSKWHRCDSDNLHQILLASSSAAEPTTVNRLVAGSIPASPANIALVAQLAERLICNQDVRSSILLGGTIFGARDCLGWSLPLHGRFQ